MPNPCGQHFDDIAQSGFHTLGMAGLLVGLHLSWMRRVCITPSSFSVLASLSRDFVTCITGATGPAS